MGRIAISKKDRVALEANMQGIENAVLASGDGEINKDNILFYTEKVREIQDKYFGNVLDENNEEETDVDNLARNSERPAVEPSIH